MRAFLLLLLGAWGAVPAAADPVPAPSAVVHGAPFALAAVREVTIVYDVERPWKVNGDAPRRVWVGERRVRVKPGPEPVRLAVSPEDAKEGRLQIDTEFYICEDRRDAPCYLRRVTFVAPVDGGAGGAAAAVVFRTPLFPRSLPDSAQKN